METGKIQTDLREEKTSKCIHIEYCTELKVVTSGCCGTYCSAKEEFDKNGYKVIPMGF